MDERESRLQCRQERERVRRDSARGNAQTVKQRELCLQQRRDQLATTSMQEREARLQQMSTLQHQRLAVESAEEAEARLQQARDRLAAESVEEREASLQLMSSHEWMP